VTQSSEFQPAALGEQTSTRSRVPTIECPLNVALRKLQPRASSAI
jgi:hypothetical protein